MEYDFTFFWLDGKAEVLKGETAADALNRGGYGRGALAALDFHGKGNILDDYKFDADARTWRQVQVKGEEDGR
jgi:hypothetical protein